MKPLVGLGAVKCKAHKKITEVAMYMELKLL